MVWDNSVFEILHGLAGASGFWDAFIVFLAQYLPYFLVFAALVFVFLQGKTRARLFAFLTLSLTILLSRGILTEIIHFVYPHARPFEALGFTPLLSAGGPSFPSGHAAAYFALAFAIYSLNRSWGLWFTVLAFVNGLARVAAGVHWPSDILGGIVLAFISIVVIRWLLKNYAPPAMTAGAPPGPQ